MITVLSIGALLALPGCYGKKKTTKIDKKAPTKMLDIDAADIDGKGVKPEDKAVNNNKF